jgi:hypothetical protein
MTLWKGRWRGKTMEGVPPNNSASSAAAATAAATAAAVAEEESDALGELPSATGFPPGLRLEVVVPPEATRFSILDNEFGREAEKEAEVDDSMFFSLSRHR